MPAATLRLLGFGLAFSDLAVDGFPRALGFRLRVWAFRVYWALRP